VRERATSYLFLSDNTISMFSSTLKMKAPFLKIPKM